MELRVVSPGEKLREAQIDLIERDLDKIAQRLKRIEDYKDILAEVRISKDGGANHRVLIELHYGRNHLIASSENSKMAAAVREARDDILRQINDRSRRGHSSFTKGR